MDKKMIAVRRRSIRQILIQGLFDRIDLLLPEYIYSLGYVDNLQPVCFGGWGDHELFPDFGKAQRYTMTLLFILL
jgi:hypothetical protein